MIAGDFNTVTDREDRCGGSRLDWNGARDGGDEDHWRTRVASRHGLFEMWQEESTFECPSGSFRIDRIYCNQFQGDQVDKRIGCAALAWDRGLSDHRPVAFARTSKEEDQGASRPPPDWI